MVDVKVVRVSDTHTGRETSSRWPTDEDRPPRTGVVRGSAGALRRHRVGRLDLADGLVDRGHEVALFAAGDSQTKARLVTSYDEPPSYRIGLSLPDLHHTLTCLERAGEFDVVNDHSGPLACALGQVVATPFCHTVHGPLRGEPGLVYAQIANMPAGPPDLAVDNQRWPLPDLNWLATCHNAIDLDDYPSTPGTTAICSSSAGCRPTRGPTTPCGSPARSACR